MSQETPNKSLPPSILQLQEEVRHPAFLSHLDLPARCYLFLLTSHFLTAKKKVLFFSDDTSVVKYLLLALGSQRVLLDCPEANHIIHEDPDTWASYAEAPFELITVEATFQEALRTETYTDVVIWSNEQHPWSYWYQTVVRHLPSKTQLHISHLVPESLCTRAEELWLEEVGDISPWKERPGKEDREQFLFWDPQRWGGKKGAVVRSAVLRDMFNITTHEEPLRNVQSFAPRQMHSTFSILPCLAISPTKESLVGRLSFSLERVTPYNKQAFSKSAGLYQKSGRVNEVLHRSKRWMELGVKVYDFMKSCSLEKLDLVQEDFYLETFNTLSSKVACLLSVSYS